MFGFVSKGISYSSRREHPDKAQTRNSGKKAVGKYQLKETLQMIDSGKSGHCQSKTNDKPGRLKQNNMY